MISKIRLVCVGKIKERYINEGLLEYIKRLKNFCKLEIIELTDLGLEKEAEKIEKFMNPQAYLLDNNGKQFDSLEFADLLKKLDGGITFVIGSPMGISPSLKSRYQKISLSKMTFLHEMTRLILLEQIYRGYMIINNRQYHK
jgi:23S rRNA (pseudouridine1915-N3)-methyltransferase